MLKYFFKKFTIFLFIIIGLCYGRIAIGESFDARISKNQEKTINSAIKSGAKRIFIDAGVYDEQIELPDGVQLFGKDFGNTILTGGIIMHDDTAISGVTVSNHGIITAPDSDVFIDNVKINNTIDNGIENVGLGKLMLSNSEIYKSEKKEFIYAGVAELKL